MICGFENKRCCERAGDGQGLDRLSFFFCPRRRGVVRNAIIHLAAAAAVGSNITRVANDLAPAENKILNLLLRHKKIQTVNVYG